MSWHEDGEKKVKEVSGEPNEGKEAALEVAKEWQTEKLEFKNKKWQRRYTKEFQRLFPKL